MTLAKTQRHYSEPPIQLCSPDHQRKEWLDQQKAQRNADTARIGLSLLLLSFVAIKPLNATLEWGLRTLGMPTFDATGIEKNFKELNEDKSFNRTLKDGDKVLQWEITSPFGDRTHPITGEKRAHRGIDVNTPVGTPIYAVGRPRDNALDLGKMFDDEIVRVECFNDDKGGLSAIAKSSLMPEHEFWYHHLDTCLDGGWASGAVIGTTGNTGASTAPHLHFGVKFKGNFIDPPSGFLLWTLQGKEPKPVIAKAGNIDAFLHLIRYAEGTDHDKGYNTMFSGKTFDDFSKHPDQVHKAKSNGKPLASAAAGAYQIMPDTWERIAPKIDALDFSPANQDRAAIFLLKERGAYELVNQGKIKEAIFASCEEWASLPCFDGDTKGTYNQPVKPLANLLMKHQEYLKEGK